LADTHGIAKYARTYIQKYSHTPKHELTSDTFKKQADIRHVFSDPAHGSRVRLSAASLTNPLQDPILRQEVDNDPMPIDTLKGAVSKADVTLLQQTAVPFHLVTFRPLS